MKKTLIVVWLLLLASTAAIAQVPGKGNIYVGYSHLRVRDLGGFNGWTGSLEGRILPHVGIVADISGNYGSENAILLPGIFASRGDADSSAHTILFGPRVSGRIDNIRPFGHALFGISRWKTEYQFVRVSEPEVILNGESDGTDFATAIGGGLDYSFAGPAAWRVQIDYLNSKYFGSGRESSFRFSTGLVLNF